MGAKASDLGARIWSRRAPTGMRTTPMAPSSTRRTPYAITGDISGAWTMFILNKSEGFTQAGVERLNDSIRTYVWAILGAQAQTRSNILMAGTGFDAQKQFLANVEDPIASPVDIPSSIARYQRHSSMHQPFWTSFLGLGSTSPRVTWPSIRAMSRATTTKSWSLDLKQQSATTRESTSRSR